jgi:hypothetical protein
MSGQNDEAAVKDSAPTNVFDLEVKYGALAVALAYMVGYVYEVGFGLRLYVPLAEMQLGTAHLLASGFTILFRSLVPTIFSLAYLRFIVTEASRYYEKAISGLFPAIYAVVLCVYFYLHHTRPVSSVVIMVAGVYVINTLIGWLLVNAEKFPAWKLKPVEQLAALLAFLLVFQGVPSNYGKTEERAQETKMMRLLFAPETVDGARQMGIHFGNANSSATSAQLSDPVSLAYQGEHSYFLALQDGSVLRISKDKVWGVYTAPR